MVFILVVSSLVIAFLVIAKTRTFLYSKTPELVDDGIIYADHLPPRYYGYWKYTRGGFSELNRCSGCFLVGLREDLHEAHVCFRCGGKLISRISGENIIGKWETKYWVDRNGKILDAHITT